MSFFNVFIGAGISLAMQLFAAFFAVSLALFTVSNKHVKSGRDSKLSRANKKLKICVIISAVLFAVSIITLIVLLCVLPAGTLYWLG